MSNSIVRRKPNPVLPTKREIEAATAASRLFSAVDADEEEFRVQLEGGVQLVLPSSVRALLMQMLTEMSRGNMVRIIPVHAVLSTQEAADYLNVSRPYLIKLLERGEIKYQMVGTHRRVKFEDLNAFKAKQDQEHDDAMMELAQQAQELNMGY